MTDEQHKSAVAKCVPLSHFGGHAPRGLKVGKCANPKCERAIVISPSTLKVLTEDRCYCGPCADMLFAILASKGNMPELVKLPGLEDPDNPVQRAILHGELKANPDSIIHKLREIDVEKELGIKPD